MHACVLLDLESSGGRNVFGPISSPGCGPPRGSAVTEESYRAYLADRARCGARGVGPLQLTWGPLQDIADEQGGCWRPEINVRVGLELFAGHLTKMADPARSYSLYNTGKPDPSPYAAKAMTLLPGWQAVIENQPVA